MSYQKLQTASELYVKLNDVNTQIEGLEKIAMQVVDGSPEVSLSLSILSPDEFKNGPVLNNNGDLNSVQEHYLLQQDRLRNYFIGGYPTDQRSTFSSEPKPTTFYNTLSDVVTLQILNMIMFEKKQIKKGLIEKIKELNLV